MTKAEERASELHILMWDTPFYNGFTKGYETAEKDLELTVDDIKNIDRLLNQCIDCNNPYQEVLKRFKEMKETKD